MPGKLDRNLRKGHLAEDIGINILRGFSAVADSRQQDDIGVDAFAVLLRRDGRSLFAESAFGIQFKSISIKNISYDERETKWFEEQEIPIFFSQIDSKNGTASFYAPIRHNKYQTLEKKYTNLTFVFDKDTDEVKDGTAYIGLSPPIFNCSEKEARTDEFFDRAYKLFNSWISFINVNNELRKFGIFRTPKWEMNGEPEEFWNDSKSLIPDRQQHLSMASPIFDKLSFHALGSDSLDKSLLEAFLRIDKWYKDEGFENGGLGSPEILENIIDSLD